MTKRQKEIKTKISEAAVYPDEGQVICHKDGTVSVKRSYFYQHGQSAGSWGEKVVQELRNVGCIVALVETRDDYNNWPKTSYFVAVIG